MSVSGCHSSEYQNVLCFLENKPMRSQKNDLFSMYFSNFKKHTSMLDTLYSNSQEIKNERFRNVLATQHNLFVLQLKFEVATLIEK